MPIGSRARILVVDDVLLEAKVMKRVLEDAGYAEVTIATDPEAAAAEVERGGVRVVVTDLDLGRASGVDLVRRVRARDDREYVYVLVTTGHGADTHLAPAFAAGADDFMTKPYRGPELVARVRAGLRIVELESVLRMQVEELDTALRRIDVAAAQRALAAAAARKVPVAASSLDALIGSEPWASAGETLGAALGDFLALPFTEQEAAPEPTEAFLAEVSLVEPTRQLEIVVTAAADAASVSAFAAHLLGEADLEGGRALLLEIANVLMGVIKTSFVDDGVTFTAGIPREVPFAEAKAAFAACRTRRRITLQTAGAKLDAWLRVGDKRNQRVSVRALREGAVIAEDVRDARGMLLIRAGARLTQTTADRLIRLVPDLEVEVSDPGPARAA